MSKEIFSNNEVVMMKSNQAKATVISVSTYTGIGTLYYLVELENNGIHHIAASDEFDRIIS